MRKRPTKGIQQLKAPATKPENLNSIPESCTEEGENQLRPLHVCHGNVLPSLETYKNIT